MGETEGIIIKGRGCEILAGMKGWRPSACLKLETGSGSFQADVYLPDIGSIGLSFSAGPRGFCSEGARVPVSHNEAPRPAGRTETAPTRPTKTPSAIVKWRQPFACLKRPEVPETKTEGPTNNPGQTRCVV